MHTVTQSAEVHIQRFKHIGGVRKHTVTRIAEFKMLTVTKIARFRLQMVNGLQDSKRASL